MITRLDPSLGNPLRGLKFLEKLANDAKAVCDARDQPYPPQLKDLIEYIKQRRAEIATWQ